MLCFALFQDGIDNYDNAGKAGKAVDMRPTYINLAKSLPGLHPIPPLLTTAEKKNGKRQEHAKQEDFNEITIKIKDALESAGKEAKKL